MKLSAVYKSSKRPDTYLYLAKKGDFKVIPEALSKQFGRPIFVMLLALDKHATIAGLPKDAFIAALTDKGYYLQLPPAQKDLLKQHRRNLGLDPNTPARDK